MARARQTITRTTIRRKTRVKKSSSSGTRGKQRRCPSCGKYM